MHALVIEDDQSMNRQIVLALRRAGYAVDSASDGEQGYYLADTADFDVVILDLGLPIIGGIEILAKWRTAGRTMPVLVLTADDIWSDKVTAIDGGADDYLTKPFVMEELLARVRALIRRSHGFADSTLICGDVKMDIRSGSVTCAGDPVLLTKFEQRLLQYLMHRAGDTVGRSEIEEHIYPQDKEPDSNTVDVLVRRLRIKLGQDAIETIRGHGFRMTRAIGSQEKSKRPSG